VDASRFGGVQIAANYNLQGNWSNSGNWYVLTSTDGATWSALNTAAWSKANAWQTGIIGTTTSTASTIYFRVFAAGAQYSGNPSATNGIMYLDDIVVSGCLLPDAPTLSKAFSPVTIPQGSASTLTFTLTNPNSSALTGVSFTDTLPTGLTINTPNGLTASCTTGTLTGGTTTAVSGTTLISLSGATLSANANCTISVSVKGNAAGDYTNISGNISSTETGVNTTSNGYGASSLTVVAPPVIAKSFTANPIFTGNTTTLTFNITNPNTTVSLTGVNFTDNLPPGLVVDSLTSNTCGGTATATNGSSTISLSGVTLAAGASCTVSVSVQGTSAGLKENSVTVNSTNGGTGNTSTASVVVKAPAPAINLLKQVGPTASGPWTSFLGITSLPANVYYKFTVENIGDVALASVNVTDSTVPVINTALGSCSWTDGDGTSLTAPFSLPVADVSDNQLATCIIGPFTASSGSHPNTATASGAYNSTTVTDTSTATYGTAELTLDKTVTETYFISAGTILHYSYLVTNSGGAPLPGPVTVSDDKATVTCPDVSTVGDNDNYFDPGESLTCTASYSVTAGDVTAGSVTNTASAAASGITSNTDSETVYKAADFTADKTNNVSGTAAQNGTFNWTITVTNISSGAGQFKNTQTILSDSLPGAAGYYTAGPLTVMPGGTAPTGGTIDCSITGTTLSCVANGDVTFPANASFSVTFAVTPTAAGSLINTATVDPNGSITELDETNNSDQDTVTVIAPPSISKSFAPDPILVGEISTLTFTITNPNSGTALTGVGFTDSLPSGLEVAPTPNKSVSAGCGSPTFTPAAGGTTLTFTGGTIPASGTCTVTVDITATTNGVMSNTTGNVTSTNGGTGNTGSDTLTVNPKADLAVTKDDGVTSVSAGGTTIYTIRVTNNGPSSVTGAVLSDPFVTGLSKTAVACSPTSGQCVTPPTVSQLEGGTFALPALASGEFYEITVTANVTATSGSVTNTAAVAPPSGTTDSDNTNDSDNDTDTVSSAPAIALTKTATLDDTVVAPSGVVNAGDRITYTFSVKNTGNVIITNIVVTDPLLPTLSCTIASLAPGATASCTASNNIYILTQADIDAGSRANTATATGKDPGNNDVTDTDSKTVTLTQNPSLNVVKSSTTTSITAAGQVAPYTFTVTNTGNVTLTNVTVTDAKCDASPTLQSGDTDNDSKLDLTETWVFTCSHTVTQAEVDAGGNLSNTVTADSTESGPDTDTLNIPITQTASMTVEKSSATTSLSAPGKVTYNYQVTNTGNVTLTGISLSDDNDNDDMNCPAATLAPSATMTCSATHTFTQAELDAGGTLDNTVTASSNEAPDATDNLSIPINQNPELTIVKSSDATGTNAVGDTITYTYDVENTGNVTLTNVTVTDAHAGLSAITCTPAQGSTLAPGDTMQCTATYVLTQDDIDAGKVDNTGVVTGTPPSGLKVTDDDLLSEPIAQAPGIDVQKTLVSVTFDSPQLIRMTYSIVVTNTGDTTLTQIQVTDDLASAFAPASSFSIVSVLSSVFTVNPAFNGSSNTNLLTGTDALAPADSGTITLVVLVDSGGDADNYTNTAVSSGKPPSGPDVTDTDSTSGPSFVDPVVTKAVNPSQAAVGDPVTFTITVTNNGTLPAANVFVTDTLPDALDLASVNPVEINPPAAGTFTITPPRTVTIDLGTLDVDEVIVITIRAIVNNLDNPPIQNTAQVTTDSPFSLTALWDGDLTSNNTSTASINAPSGGGGGGGGGTGGGGLHIPITGGLLPSTGFAPGVITSVPPQPLEKAYFATDDIWLEIPRLGVSTSIVGVPRSADGNWDVTWLLQEAGWLQGTAFPTWKGNSVLTGHVYLPSGKPGPFVDLAKLRWDDKIIVRAFGQEYVYRVRENLVVSPTDTSVIKHEDDAWLTLITCKGYDEKSNTYAHRVVIRAVLVSVEDARKSTPNGGR
jgi:LPXTG-site transpeptidase (sortase) family protein